MAQNEAPGSITVLQQITETRPMAAGASSLRHRDDGAAQASVLPKGLGRLWVIQPCPDSTLLCLGVNLSLSSQR